MKKVVFIAYLTNYGGIETFIYRMAKWMHLIGIDVTIFCDKDREQDKALVEDMLSVKAKIEKVSFRKKHNVLSKYQNRFTDCRTVCITFSYPGLILADSFFGKRKNVDIIFYDPHQYGLMMDYWASNKKIKLILKLVSAFFGRRMYKRHQIIFMDYLCKKRTLKEFNLKSLYSDDVLFLPMEIAPLDEKKIQLKNRKENFNILTICRMTFPFKGYIFGLIDDFVFLQKKYPFLTLTIIGKGQDQAKLEEKLCQISDKVREKIVWIKGVPYSELSKYFLEASLYVGMGTTIIDAVNKGVPAFSIGSYTLECKGYDYFYVDGTNLGGLYGNKSIRTLMEQIINFDDAQYLELCKKDHVELSKIYNIEKIGRKILSFRNNKHGIFNNFERFFLPIAKRFVR